MGKSVAVIVREYGPFSGIDHVRGVSYDGKNIWIAASDKLLAIDAVEGTVVRMLEVACHAGAAFDGKHLYLIAENRIDKIDAHTGRIVHTIPAPGNGSDSGLAWAEGVLWVGQYRERKIHQIDPGTGEILRTINSNRFVTGVTWIGGELWHGTWEGSESELRHINSATGEVLEQLLMPEGTAISGLESDSTDRFFCGGGSSGKVRAVKRPARQKS